MTGTEQVIGALRAEADEFDHMVAALPPARWATPTPAPGWTVAHQVGHVAFVFRIAGLAASDPRAFGAVAAAAGEGGFDAAVNAALAEYVALAPAELLARWRAESATAVDALAAVPADRVVPWLVSPLPPAVLACAGMMELFAHGQDVADALGVDRVRTDRVAHLAGFVARTRDFAYQARGTTPPDDEFRFELVTPSGSPLVIGPADATQRITGDAVDLCLVATRRRHRLDTGLVARGDLADAWLDIAQAYRGPAGPGRAPGQFAAAA